MAAAGPGSEWDAFVSYAHNDDASTGPDGTRLVRRLVEDLQQRLHKTLRREPRIWSDRTHAGSTPEILFELRRSRTLLSFVSRSFVDSEWCTEELERFAEDRQDGVFKIILDGIRRDQQPLLVKDLQDYPFIHEQDGVVRELWPDNSDEERRAYWGELVRLAEHVAAYLRKPKAATIFVADTPSSIKSERRDLRRRLADAGFEVIPRQEFSWMQGQDVWRPEILNELKRADLAVVLVGPGEMARPAESDLSIQAIQLKLARELQEGPRCLVWSHREAGIGWRNVEEGVASMLVQDDWYTALPPDFVEAGGKLIAAANAVAGQLEEAVGGPGGGAVAQLQRVFLAGGSLDLLGPIRRLRRLLEADGAEIYDPPSWTSSAADAGWERELEEAMKQAGVVVLPLSARRDSSGDVPERVRRQIEVARRLAQRSQVVACLWLCGDIESGGGEWPPFLETTLEAPGSLELLGSDVAEVQRWSLETSAPAEEPDGETHCTVYLLHSEEDEQDPQSRELLAQVEATLTAHGCYVQRPLFEGATEDELNEDHQAALRDCDRLLVFWATGSELWFRGRLREANRAVATGKSRRPMGMVLAPPTDARGAKGRTRPPRWERMDFLSGDGNGALIEFAAPAQTADD